ncbi:diadenylate cyclase CdaA [Ancylomarina sp. 16SWW S1-10-2]|uniref:diadenylate cyclase CdaA n=1 Tax=Ancylomarina sp. 16SWW S1-10-2 TaxID=2499681 RepID=UPI0012AD6BD2|nr:diadenylate cyclase CdaA [Ancylomarina sp. 16SWW S1-10-2]MRT92841.1 TIGR00159 family protein [Ancylomarina sp. 16SWW S1-10-2]
MLLAFITLSFFDVLDILLVAFLLYQVYMLIRGTVAINIFVGLFLFYLMWLIVKALNMELLSSILGQFIGVGVIALLIVFQQEVRKFLLHLGSRYNISQKFSIEKWFYTDEKSVKDKEIDAIIESCEHMSKSRTGALIVITKRTNLYSFADTGQILKARISSSLLETVFFKNSPLHDGALILDNNRILAARCILPVSDNPNIPGSLGLRHRAAIGISQMTDSHVIVVSEETGNISYVMGGKIKVKISSNELRSFLNADFSSFVS